MMSYTQYSRFFLPALYQILMPANTNLQPALGYYGADKVLWSTNPYIDVRLLLDERTYRFTYTLPDHQVVADISDFESVQQVVQFMNEYNHDAPGCTNPSILASLIPSLTRLRTEPVGIKINVVERNSRYPKSTTVFDNRPAVQRNLQRPSLYTRLQRALLEGRFLASLRLTKKAKE